MFQQICLNGWSQWPVIQYQILYFFYIYIYICIYIYETKYGLKSIFTFILSFQKNKYQIQSYTTFNMDDFKTIYIYIYIYENLLVVAYFSINGRFCLVSLGNSTFSNVFPRAKHVLMTFELWTLCARLCIFSLYISHLLLSSQQASIAMWTILISKSWWLLLKLKR